MSTARIASLPMPAAIEQAEGLESAVLKTRIHDCDSGLVVSLAGEDTAADLRQTRYRGRLLGRLIIPATLLVSGVATYTGGEVLDNNIARNVAFGLGVAAVASKGFHAVGCMLQSSYNYEELVNDRKKDQEEASTEVR